MFDKLSPSFLFFFCGAGALFSFDAGQRYKMIMLLSFVIARVYV